MIQIWLLTHGDDFRTQHGSILLLSHGQYHVCAARSRSELAIITLGEGRILFDAAVLRMVYMNLFTQRIGPSELGEEQRRGRSVASGAAQMHMVHPACVPAREAGFEKNLPIAVRYL